MYPRSEILFPHNCIRGLRNLLDAPWADLVDQVGRLDESTEDSLAFSLMMIKLCGCISCDMGSYKASLGCDICSQRAVATAKGSSQLLMRRYEKACADIRRYLEHGKADIEMEQAEGEEILVA